MLAVNNLEVVYDDVVLVLRGVSLQVPEGQVVGLLGANGAGKTTTLRTISGMHRPYSGEILYQGRRVDGVPSHEVVGLGLGHVPEGRRVFPRMSVLENLQMGAYRFRHDIKDDLNRVFDLFPVLLERKKQPGGVLSGGEQQMLAIGRALMGRPKLLLLDEPSMGLAPLIVAKIFEIIKEINAQGTTVLLVEQNAAQALRLASRGYVLETGEIVMADESAVLLKDEGIKAAYLGEGAAGPKGAPNPA